MQPHLLTSLAHPPRILVDDAVTLPRVARVAARGADGDTPSTISVRPVDGGAVVRVDGIDALLLTAEDGGLWWTDDETTFDLLGLPHGVPIGPLGLVCDDLATAAHAVARARDEGFGFRAIAVTSPGCPAEALFTAIDPACMPDAWVLATSRFERAEDFAALCRRVTVHRPVVAVWPCAPSSVAEEAWRAGLAVILAPTFDDALDRGLGLATLLQPAGPSIAVYATDDGLAGWVARSIARVGGRVDAHSSDDPIEAAALQRERLDYDLIAVVAPTGSGASLRALAASELLEGPDLPVVVVAADQPTRVAGRRLGLCVVATLDAPGALLAAMSRWGRAADRALAQLEPAGRVADASRLRGALAGPRRRGHTTPDDGAEVAAALALPMARRATVRWPDDALLAASEYGYPVEVASMAPPAVERAHNADELGAAVARRLAAARAATGPDAAVEVRAVADSARRWRLTALTDARWGARIELSVDGLRHAWACPVDATFGAGLLDPRATRGAMEQDVLTDVARALDAMTATIAEVPTVRVDLDVDDRGGRVVALTLDPDLDPDP